MGKSKTCKKIFSLDAAGINDAERTFFSEIVFPLQTNFFVYGGILQVEFV